MRKKYPLYKIHNPLIELAKMLLYSEYWKRLRNNYYLQTTKLSD